MLKAATGESVPNFPFRAFGKVMAPPLLTKLDDRKPRGLQIVVTAFDGFLYVIDGITGGRQECVQRHVGRGRLSAVLRRGWRRVCMAVASCWQASLLSGDFNSYCNHWEVYLQHTPQAHDSLHKDSKPINCLHDVHTLAAQAVRTAWT